MDQARKLCDIDDVIALHEQMDPAETERTWYVGNYQWSPDGEQVNFFAAFFYRCRVVRDLCIVNADGTGLRLLLSSEDTLRFPEEGRKRRYGDLFPSGTVLNNHQVFLPNGKQILFCTQDPFALPPGETPDPEDAYLNTRLTALLDIDTLELQVLQADDRNFDGHPSSNPQGTLWLGSDYSRYIKIMDPHTLHVRNIFSLPPCRHAHPHETWSRDGRYIMFRRNGKAGELFTADVSDL